MGVYLGPKTCQTPCFLQEFCTLVITLCAMVPLKDFIVFTGIIKWDPFGGSATLQMYGQLEGFPLKNNAICLGW